MPMQLDALQQSLSELIAASETDARDIAIDGLRLLSGGNARQAFSFDAAWSAKGQRQQRSCVMLVKAGAGQLETNLTDEFRTLKSLEGQDLPVATALWLDGDGQFIGKPAIVMTRIEGDASIVRLLNPADPAVTRSLSLRLADVAARLHAVPLADAASTTEPAAVRAAIEHQVEYWKDIFLRNRFEPQPTMAYLFDWLFDNIPVPDRLSLVHGDLRLGNFLHQDGRITALLDWELAHIGDAVEDIAWAYRPLWSPEQFLTIGEFVAAYSEQTGVVIEPPRLVYYRIFSELKFCAISLTAARAFADGRSQNIRFADRASKVAPALAQCLQWLESGESRLS